MTSSHTITYRTRDGRYVGRDVIDTARIDAAGDARGIVCASMDDVAARRKRVAAAVGVPYVIAIWTAA